MTTSSNLHDTNRAIVLAFYEMGFVRRQVRMAFAKHASPEFIEHKPDVESGTREAVVEYLEDLIDTLPDASWEVIRTIAEGDFVFLHARFIPSPGAPPYACADVFRLQDGCIVEHWDVISGPPKSHQNPNSRF